MLKKRARVCEMFNIYTHYTTLTFAGVVDTYEQHFGVKPSVLSETSRIAVDGSSWKLLKEQRGQLGWTALSVPEGSELLTNPTAQIDVMFHLAYSILLPILIPDCRTTENAVPLPPIKTVAWFVHHHNSPRYSQTY